MRTIFFSGEVFVLAADNTKGNQIKQRTLELYDQLPMELEARKKCIDIRNEIIQLNYRFFGYVATETFVANASYEDKFQTAVMAFLNMWWKYKYAPKYRTDLSFAVFFKPRLSEEIRRYLNTYSYTQRRTLCIKAAAQLHKPWSSVNYDDLANVNLPEDELNALKAILGTVHPMDISELGIFIADHSPMQGIEKYRTTKYDTIEELLIQEMIEQEAPITDKQLHDMANMYDITYLELKEALPRAMQILHDRLTDNIL